MKLTKYTLARGLKIPLDDRAENWHEFLLLTFERYGIRSDLEKLTFISQVAYETGHLRSLIESLYYTTPERILQVFPSFIKPEEVQRFVKNGEALANRVYANRLGNGDEASGDGWRFIGRGGFMLTGRENYKKYSDHSGVDCVHYPSRLQGIEHACLSAGWFWETKGVGRNVLNFPLVTKLISGSKSTTAKRALILIDLQKATS